MQLKELPINGRNVYNLIALQPGMTGRGLSPGLFSGGGSDSFSGETQPQAYASGQRWEANNYTVDDTSVNGVARNGAANLTPNTESVEEVRVVANNFSAVDGRNSGGQVQVITKGGTNQFHGSLSWYFTNNTLASRNFNETTLPAVRKNLYGYSRGRADQAQPDFLLHQLRRLAPVRRPRQHFTVETPEFRDFVLQHPPEFDRGQTHVPRLRARRCIQPPTSAIWAAPPRARRTNGSGSMEFRISADINYHAGVIPKRPQLLSASTTSCGPARIAFTAAGIETPTKRWAAESVRSSTPTCKETTHFGNINYTHTFDSTKLNEFRAGVMQLIGRPEIRKRLEIPGVTITSLSGFGGGQYPSGWWQTNYHYKDIFSWVRSTHTIKIGGELRHMRGSAQNTANFIPTYSFNSILDFADDDAQSMNRLVNPVTGEPAGVFSQLRQTEWASSSRTIGKSGATSPSTSACAMRTTEHSRTRTTRCVL